MTWRAQPLVDNSDGLFAEVARSHAKRNCLVLGPAGSGKLSLVRGLAALTNSRSRKFLFDWEVEESAQQRLLMDLKERVNAGVRNPEVWIQRKIHLIKLEDLGQVLLSLRQIQSLNENLITCYATSEFAIDHGEVAHELEEFFPVRITLGEGGFASGSLDSILSCALASLRRKYGRGATSIEPEAFHYLTGLSLQTQMSAMLSALERAFVLESGPTLRLATLQDLSPGRSSRGNSNQ